MKNTTLLLAVFLCFSAVNGFCSGSKELKKDIARLEESLAREHKEVVILQEQVDLLRGKINGLGNNTASENQENIWQFPANMATAEKSDRIMDNGSLRLEVVVEFIRSKNPNWRFEDITELLHIYEEEADREEVNYDIAIAQMCYATDYLKKDTHYNYAGFSPQGTGRTTIVFKNKIEGIRAHIQHLKAYATPDIIPENQLVDPRHKILEKEGYRNSVTTFDQLYAKWAGKKNEARYRSAITEILTELYWASDNL